MSRSVPIRRLSDGTVYPSIRAAARANYVDQMSIHAALKRRNGTAGGHQWELVTEAEPEVPPSQRPFALADALYVLDEIDVVVRWEMQGAIAPADAWQTLRHIWRTQKVKERLSVTG